MTYSYATRTWAITHMSNDFFGLHTIARAAGVKPRTLQSWFRQETHRAQLSIKMPREYERSMGIILLDLFPKDIETIAKLTFTNSRSLLQWRLENKNCHASSDLRYRTFKAVALLKPIVAQLIRKHGKNKMLESKMLWPDPYLVFERTWLELDLTLIYTLFKVFDWRYYKDNEETAALSKMKKPKTMIGPHSTRYTEITNEGQHFPLESFRYSRRTEHILGWYNQEAAEKTLLTKSLLPPDWKMKDKVVKLKTKKKATVQNITGEEIPSERQRQPKSAAS